MMKYLLDEAEYAALVKAGQEQKAKYTESLQAFCTRVANELPIDGWHTHDQGKAPWGCIITEQGWYCDDCPAQDFCPHDGKRWSQ